MTNILLRSVDGLEKIIEVPHPIHEIPLTIKKKYYAGKAIPISSYDSFLDKMDEVEYENRPRYRTYELSGEENGTPIYSEKLELDFKPPSKENAEEWARSICEGGAYEVMQRYKQQHQIGSIAEKLWDDDNFKYGAEYGLLIAVAHLYGDLK